LQIWPVPVTRKLHPIGEPLRKIVADVPRNGELAVSVKPNPCPDTINNSLTAHRESFTPSQKGRSALDRFGLFCYEKRSRRSYESNCERPSQG
jgi:hypothetical protein